MGPKKGRDPSQSVENHWRTSIEEATVEEDDWKVKVIIIEAAGSDQDCIYINKFETIAAEEKRFVIKNICKSETIFMINQLGSEKKIKDDSLRVFEEGQFFLKDKKEIPPDVLALIIKHLILKMKEEYLFIKRQRLEVREGMRQESTTMIDRVEVRGTVSAKAHEPLDLSSPIKGKGKKGDLESNLQTFEAIDGKKYNTSLRVRGEEWRDKVYVNDFPIDGPNLYVAITGFVQPGLPACLIKIGIQLTAVVQVRIDCTATKVPSSLIRTSKRGQSQTEILEEKSTRFWKDIQNMRTQRETADIFKDTAFIVFTPPYCDSDKLSGNSDKIYDELCFLMYDVEDLNRQHVHYLENMDIINIPLDKSDDKKFNYYLEDIQDLPLECITVYSLLNSILLSVEKCQALEKKSSTTSLSTPLFNDVISKRVDEEKKISRAEKLIKNVFSTLGKRDDIKKSFRITYGNEYEQQKDPIVIDYGDIAKYSTFHLRNFNLDNIIWTTLLGMPLHSLWESCNKAQGELEAKINFHVNVLLSCFDRTNIETPELIRLIHILAFRKLYNNRSSLKTQNTNTSNMNDFKKVFLKRSVLAEPLPRCPSSLLKISNSKSPSYLSLTKSENMSNISYGDDIDVIRVKFLFDCPDLSELVSAAEIVNEQPINHMIDEFEYFEDFTGISAFQTLLEAYNMFNCIDYKYCEVTDSILLMFFNSHDKDGVVHQEWRSHIPTPISLQDFFDFVFEEYFDWIQNEEKIYEENVIIKTQPAYKEVNPFAEKSCMETTEVELDLLMEGSLKYQKIAKMEDVSLETSDTKISSKKTTLSPISIEVDSKSGKKTKSVGSTHKHARQSFIALDTRSDSSLKIHRKPFMGYDLGSRRVEVFGRNSTYFSKDGTRVTSKYILTIPTNSEYITLNVVPGNSANEFWLHRALGEYIPAVITDTCESFRITSKDHVVIYIKKQSYAIPLPFITFSDSVSRKASTVINNETSSLFENHYFHSVIVTWPNGLITESVHLEKSSDISHIKQFHIKPVLHLNEEMRFVTLKGEVIIFRPSGIIEVLQPDGSIIKITKYGKRLLHAEPQHETISDTSSEKSKKSKVKDKTPDKTKEKSKTPTKPFKNNEDRPQQSISLEYELVFEDFETIESNGLRQRWINETPYPIEKLLIRTATDYCLREVFSRRMDGTNILLNKDGVKVVTFPNNTRIISKYFIEDELIYPEWTDEEKNLYFSFDSDEIETSTIKSKGSVSQKSYVASHNYSPSVASSKLEEEKERTDGYISVQIMYTIEHAYFSTITINKANGEITVDSPNGTKVVVDSNNHYNISLDNLTNAKFDGSNLYIDYQACSECRSTSSSSIRVKTHDQSSVTKMHQSWMKMEDSFGKVIVVNEEGHILTMDENSSETCINEDSQYVGDKRFDNKFEAPIISHEKCREMFSAKTLRFFVLNRDLTCSELVHRAILNEYIQNCRWQPWCSINNYDTFGDHRSLLSILTPVHLTESEKWLMDSKLADKPKHLTYKDLKKDSGKGFYHWMRPYDRYQPKPTKPPNVLPERLPRAFIIRTLEQQWKDEERQTLKGAKELLVAILRYRRVMESDSELILHVPLKDIRSDVEKSTDDIIQALGQRIYQDLKTRLQQDVQERAKATITTKPQVTQEPSLEGEPEEEDLSEQRRLEEERESLLIEAEAAEISPNLKRYWRRRAEQYKEEQSYKFLLREGNVPPYFRNALGGAIWWDINKTAEEAASASERKKMKCVCVEEGTSRNDDSVTPFT